MPPTPIIDFDQHSPEYASNWLTIGRNLLANSPVAWSNAHGGFWVVSSYADCKAVASDWRTFTSENDIDGTGNGGKGIFIPPNAFQFALSESDPPQTSQIRKIEIPFFTAEAVARWETVARANAEAALDAVPQGGRIDLLHDYAMVVPARTNLALAGVPDDEWEIFALSAHKASYTPSTHLDYPLAELMFVREKILGLVRERRQNPRADMISAIIAGTVLGAPVSDDLAVDVLSAVIFGGFDTVTMTAINMFLLINDDHALRAKVLADPASMSAAIEETLRLKPPSHMLARTVTREVEIGGQAMRTGDRVLLLWAAANRDPAKFERPDELWLERPNAAQHLTFSFGVHRCLGSVLAKMEIAVIVNTMLQRFPDMRIEADEVVVYERIGGVAGYHQVPVVLGGRGAIADPSLSASATG